jgi:hypothetical protein
MIISLIVGKQTEKPGSINNDIINLSVNQMTRTEASGDRHITIAGKKNLT